MALMGALFRNVIYPAWHWAKQDGINDARRMLDRNQWRTGSEIAALQQKKLAFLMSHATSSVPYYRDLARVQGWSEADVMSPGHVSQFPYLTKSIIRREKNDLTSTDLRGNRLLPNSTSGSTGEALFFYTDTRSDAYRKAAMLRHDSWSGWQLGDRIVRLWGAPMDQSRAKNLRGRLHGLVTGDLFLSSYDLSPVSMDAYIARIQRFEPRLLVGYPGPLETFALHCRERGARFPSLKGIISSAETLWPYQREIIEEGFGVGVFNRYGSREFGLIASECELHDGLHVSTDRVLIEIMDDGGRECSPGEIGRMLITDLDNFGMPLIRYDIGDRAAWAENQTCACGRGFPLLKLVEGRTLDVVRTPSGGSIGGTFWTLLLRSRPGIRQFQVIQDRLDGVTIRFVRDERFEDAVLDKFATKIREYCGEQFQVAFTETDSIDLTASGKQRLIVCSVDQSKSPGPLGN